MTKINYRLIPQAVIRQKATRFVGNDQRQVLNDAKRHGIKIDPILSESKLGMSVAYFPNEEINQIAFELMQKQQAERNAKVQAEQKQQPTALDLAYKALRTKLNNQGVWFK